LGAGYPPPPSTPPPASTLQYLYISMTPTFPTLMDYFMILLSYYPRSKPPDFFLAAEGGMDNVTYCLIS
jgi:hypothetical protein